MTFSMLMLLFFTELNGVRQSLPTLLFIIHEKQPLVYPAAHENKGILFAL